MEFNLNKLVNLASWLGLKLNTFSQNATAEAKEKRKGKDKMMVGAGC